MSHLTTATFALSPKACDDRSMAKWASACQAPEFMHSGSPQRQNLHRPTASLSGLSCLLTALVLLCLSLTVNAQSSTDAAVEPADGTAAVKSVEDMTSEELAAFIKEQQLQLEAVKQARDEQKAKQAQVQEALIDRQEKLNEIVIELSELCSERKELDPDDTEPCMPEES